ncbi:MAG: sugar kinase [Candidatus Cloacimonetes bacterium 4572_55]|nr:MAG: sugar kinase [Candidatus Cloacimonetes bacterium 4572_55]
MAILVVGSVALDTIKTPTGKVEDAIGGSAIHFSAAASFFSPVRVVGVVGPDYPYKKIGFLKKRDVDLSGLETAEGETFRWSGEYTHDWNSAITHDTKLNVFKTFSPKISDSFRQSQFLFLANIDPTLQLQTLDQVEKPLLAAMDTMNFWIQGTKRAELLEVLKRVDLLLINDGEAKMLSKKNHLLDAAQAILQMGPQTLVIKKGEHGAVLFHKNEIFSLPAYPTKNIVDPTGAGDSFAGGFMGFLAKAGDLSQNNMRRAVVYGSVMASFMVTDFSCDRMRTLTAEDIAVRYKNFCELVRF